MKKRAWRDPGKEGGEEVDKEENSPSTKQFPKYSFLAWSGLLNV